MVMLRGELPPESRKRLERVVASGVRIERMIAQLLDLTRARLAGGIPVTRTAEQDLVPLVSKIITETGGSANPSRTFELSPPRVRASRGSTGTASSKSSRTCSAMP